MEYLKETTMPLFSPLAEADRLTLTWEKTESDMLSGFRLLAKRGYYAAEVYMRSPYVDPCWHWGIIDVSVNSQMANGLRGKLARDDGEVCFESARDAQMSATAALADIADAAVNAGQLLDKMAADLTEQDLVGAHARGYLEAMRRWAPKDAKYFAMDYAWQSAESERRPKID